MPKPEPSSEEQIERLRPVRASDGTVETRMVTDPDGPYVRFADHQATVERLEREREELRTLAIVNGGASAEHAERADQLQAVIDGAVEEFERRAAERTMGGVSYLMGRRNAYTDAVRILRSNQPSDPGEGAPARCVDHFSIDSQGRPTKVPSEIPGAHLIRAAHEANCAGCPDCKQGEEGS